MSHPRVAHGNNWIQQELFFTRVYKVEGVRKSDGNGCLLLKLPQKHPCLFRCSLQLLEVTVVLEFCKKKKDADLPWRKLLKMFCLLIPKILFLIHACNFTLLERVHGCR